MTFFRGEFTRYATSTAVLGSFAGCCFLVWFCFSAKVPFPTEASSLPTLFLVLAYTGISFTLLLLATYLIPFVLPAIEKNLDSKALFRNLFEGSLGQHVILLFVFGFPMTLTQIWIFAKTIRESYQFDMMTFVYILAAVVSVFFVTANIYLAKTIDSLESLFPKVLRVTFISFGVALFFILWSLYAQLLVFNVVADIVPTSIDISIGWFGFIWSVISFSLVSICYFLVRAGYHYTRTKRTGVNTLLTALTATALFAIPIPAKIGEYGLKVLQTGGYIPVCYVFDPKNQGAIPESSYTAMKTKIVDTPGADCKASNAKLNVISKSDCTVSKTLLVTTKPIFLVHSIGPSIFVTNDMDTKKPFSIRKDFILNQFPPTTKKSESEKKVLECDL